MPRYNYYCKKCEKYTEIEHKIADLDKKHKCSKCKKAMERHIGNTRFDLRGSGFYKNDYTIKESL